MAGVWLGTTSVGKAEGEARVEDKERLRERVEREIERQIDLFNFHAVERVEDELSGRKPGRHDHLFRARAARTRGEALCVLLREVKGLRHDRAVAEADRLDAILAEAFFATPSPSEDAPPAGERREHRCQCGRALCPPGGVGLLEQPDREERHHNLGDVVPCTVQMKGSTRVCRIDCHPAHCACADAPPPKDRDPDRIALVFRETLKKVAAKGGAR
jgi:hypothetical protein